MGPEQAVPDRIRRAIAVASASDGAARTLELPRWSGQVDRRRAAARLSGSRACLWQTGTMSRKRRVWKVELPENLRVSISQRLLG